MKITAKRYLELTSWNFKNFEALSWRIRCPFARLTWQRLDGHSNRGMNTRAVTSCFIEIACYKGKNVCLKKIPHAGLGMITTLHTYLIYFKTTLFTCVHSNLHQWFYIWTASHNARYLDKLANMWSPNLPNGKWLDLGGSFDVNFAELQTMSIRNLAKSVTSTKTLIFST